MSTKTLLELLPTADLLEIDGNSIRHFANGIFGEDCDEDDIAMDVSLDDDTEGEVSLRELRDAVYYPDHGFWCVYRGDGINRPEPYHLRIFSITAITDNAE